MEKLSEDPNENISQQSAVNRKEEQLGNSSKSINSISNSDNITVQCLADSNKSLSIQILAKRRISSATSLQCIVYKRPKKMPMLADLEKMFESSANDIEENFTENRQTPSDRGKQIIIPLLDENNQSTDSNIATSRKFILSPQQDVQKNLNQTSGTLENSRNSNILDSTYIDLTMSRNQNTQNKIDLTLEGSNDSDTSTKTITYDLNTSSHMADRYSPTPSTSRQSLCDLSKMKMRNSTGVEIAENANETIVIEDDLPEVHIQEHSTVDVTSQKTAPSTSNPVANNSKNNTTRMECTDSFDSRRGLSDCPICMEPLISDIACTKCGHVFCINCLEAAIKQSGKKCPKCRKALRKPFYHQIYL